MSTGTTAAPAAVSERHVLAEARPARPPSQWRRALSFSNIGAVYVWLLIILVFAIWVPNTFLTQTTFNQILNNNAVTGLMALCVVIPLAARVFDLSIAFTMTLSAMSPVTALLLRICSNVVRVANVPGTQTVNARMMSSHT